METIESGLRNNILFGELGDEELSLMVATMKQKIVQPNQHLITQGEMGDNFYVVDYGEFYYEVDGECVGENAEVGATFGELALLYNSPRAASVISTVESKCWVLPRDHFRKIVASTANKSRTKVADSLKSVYLLKGLTNDQINALVDATTIVHFEPNDTIIAKGDEGSIFYFLKSGDVECTKIGKGEDMNNLNLGPGDYFGERALMRNEPRAANVIARTACECIALSKDDFEKYLGSLLDTLDANLGKRVLKSLPILKELTEKERAQIVEEFKEESFKAGEFIVRQGEAGSTFYIIRDGVAEVNKNVKGANEPAVVATLNPGDYFGEGALLEDEKRGANVVAKGGEVKVFSLERAAFDKYMNKSKNRMSKHFSTRQDQTADAVKKATRSVESQIKFKDLVQIRTLGTGTFGRVKLVEHKGMKRAFALKVLQKAQVVAYRQQTNVLNEKDIMAESDHPFILRLFKTFKDNNCLYMLLELVLGGELFSLLHIRGGKLADKDSRFYAACVLDALEYLHDRTIVYRDLKPENLLIDDVGYIKVVDFGFAKKVLDKTFTLCGTPEYLSPELVLGKGHNKGVDIWALGILIFEMITGASPFADSINTDHMVICKKIVRGALEFPSARKYPEKAKDLTQKLLVRESHLRIGCLAGGSQDIKDHAWFRGLDWRELYRKRIKAPWIPDIKSHLDTSNFEPYDEDDSVDPYMDNGNGWDNDF